jgi:NDP-4-keto-2,6-dideoxyhexose 3-C-methyltransferase
MITEIILNERTDCRVCGANVKQVIDFGSIHINDFPLDPESSPGKAPMVLDQCVECDLVQLRHTVNPKILYGEHYWYESGLNKKLTDNLIDIAEYVNEHTDKDDIVLDIGANDGTLLSAVSNDRHRIGCEPAPNLIKKLKKNCDEVINDMWHHDMMQGKKAKAITAIGMFYDMDNPNDFIHSVNESLSDDGVFIAQLMTLAPMLKMKDLGNVCHEHLEYYSYKSLVHLYEKNGLEIYKVVQNDIQGGSYQLWARKLNEGSIEYYEDISTLETFFEDVERNGRLLRIVLKDSIDNGNKNYVYGASTKGNTMLQLWKLDGLFDGAAEIHPDKVGRYTVGTGIPIVHEDDAKKEANLFFVPNFGFKDMFVEKENEWINNGGRMLFAMPTVNIAEKTE